MGKMLENDPIVDSLLAENPFKGKQPPKHVRARLVYMIIMVMLLGYLHKYMNVSDCICLFSSLCHPLSPLSIYLQAF